MKKEKIISRVLSNLGNYRDRKRAIKAAISLAISEDRKEVLKLVDDMYNKLEVRSYKDKSGEILIKLKQKIKEIK